MKALFPMMLGITVLLLIIEIVAGRHRGIYRREDWLVIGLPALLNPMVSAPLAGFIVGSVAAFLFPGQAGALAAVPMLPAYLGILLLAEFCFYWVHRLSHQGMKKGSRLRWLWKRTARTTPANT